MTFRVFSDLDSALAAEEALFDCIGEGAESACLLWSARRGLVIPRSLSQRPGFIDSARQSAARGWPVSVRSSGGDLVPQGPGTLNFCRVWMPSGPISIEEGYKAICDPIRSVLGGYCAPVEACFCDGKYNVVVADRKVAGTAQRRRQLNGRLVVLAHAMILVNEDIEAGVDAVNAFQASLGFGGDVRSAAHVNASEVMSHPPLTPRKLAARIASAMDDASWPIASGPMKPSNLKEPDPQFGMPEAHVFQSASGQGRYQQERTVK